MSDEFSLPEHLHGALWRASELCHSQSRCTDTGFALLSSELPLLTEGQSLVADYRTLGLTLGRHPLALLRDKLTAMRFSSSAQLREQPDRRLVRACSIVTVRQRPGTSKGVVFVILEDETGQVNLVVRSNIIERQRRELLTSRLLGAYGTWQSHSGVQHLIVGRLVDLTPMLGELEILSRDFH